MKADALEKAKKEAALKLALEEKRQKDEAIAQAKQVLSQKLKKAAEEEK
jgi:hypothetical protein